MRTILTPLLTVLLAVAVLTVAALPADAAGTAPPSRRIAVAKADRDDAVDRAQALAGRLRRVTVRIDEVASETNLLGLRRAEVAHKLAAAEVRLSDSADDVYVTSFVSLIDQVAHGQLAAEADELAGRHGDLSGDQEELSDRRDQLAKRLQVARRQARKAVARIEQLKQLRPKISDNGDDIVRVGEINVQAEIAKDLAQLLWHARADGHNLSGYGYRSPETTAQLRIANGCPDIHISPASSCRVPTARPGTSMHETGLAVDFTVDGNTLCFPRPGSSCDHPAYKWLVQHADDYGLINLPTEAWHWSTTGG